jgi:hypothetical protein
MNVRDGVHFREVERGCDVEPGCEEKACSRPGKEVFGIGDVAQECDGEIATGESPLRIMRVLGMRRSRRYWEAVIVS